MRSAPLQSDQALQSDYPSTSPQSQQTWGVDPMMAAAENAVPTALGQSLVNTSSLRNKLFKVFFLISNHFCGCGESPTHLIVLFRTKIWDKKWRHSFHKTSIQEHFIHYLGLSGGRGKYSWYNTEQRHTVSHLTVWTFEMVPYYP